MKFPKYDELSNKCDKYKKILSILYRPSYKK